MASTKKGDYTVLVLFVVVSAALLSILFLKQDTPTGYAVFDGNLDVLKSKVEQFVRTMPLTALAGDGAEVCLIIYDNENAYTFDLFKSDGQVEVTYNPYSRYCDNDINNQGREDLVIQYIDYESFLSHAADPACSLLKSTGAGQDFYYLPSEFMQQGGIPVCNDLFKERYCPAVRACTAVAERSATGLDCCNLAAEKERQFPQLLTSKYVLFFGLLFLFGFTVIVVVYLIEEQKEKRDREELEKCLEQLTVYVDYCTGLGHRQEEINQRLLRQGWAKDVVEYVARGKKGKGMVG